MESFVATTTQSKKLKALMGRVERWPSEAQERALESLQMIEKGLRETTEFSAEDRAAFERSAEDVRQGRFASDERVREVFDRFPRSGFAYQYCTR